MNDQDSRVSREYEDESLRDIELESTSGELLAEEANGGNWLEGHRFRSNPSDSDIQEWTDSIQ